MEEAQQPTAGLTAEDTPKEAFLGGFTRTPNGLDPTEVYSYFLRLSARVQELEAQAQHTSAPFVLEAALKEAAEVRSQHAAAAERAYNEIVSAAQQEADSLRGTAQRQAGETLDSARIQADEILNRARNHSEEVTRQASEGTEQAEAELERLCVDYASFLQRLLERRKGQPAPAADSAGPQTTPAPPAPPAAVESAPSGPLVPPATAAPEPKASPPTTPPPTGAESRAGGGKEDDFRLPSWLE